MSVDSALTSLIEMSLSISILMLVVLLIRKPFAKAFGANAAYALWLAPLARPFLPQLNVLPAPEPQPVLAAWTSTAQRGAQSVSDFTVGAPQADLHIMGIASALLITLWLLIVITMIGYAIERHRNAMKDAYQRSKQASSRTIENVQTIAREFRLFRTPKIRILDEETGPAVTGLFTPVILLPSNFDTGYTQRERNLILTHEIAHIARGDLLTAAIAKIFLACQWFNPLAHVALRAFRTDQEAACDETVLSRRKISSDKAHYASAIMKSIKSGGAATLPGLTLNHPLKERLMFLRNEQKSPSRKVTGRVLASSVLIAGLLGTASYGYADDKEEKVEIKKEKHIMIIKDGDEDMDFDFEEFEGDGDIEIVIDGEGGGQRRVMRRVTADGLEGDEEIIKAHCSSDGDSEAVKLEWTDESGDGDEKHVEHSVICLSGDDAKPENQIAALEQAIDRMEENAKRQEERRKRMIAGLREQLKKMEAEE